jgi:recombination protein RecT
MTQEVSRTGIKDISHFLNSDAIKSKFTEILGSKGQGFIASVLTACNLNQELKNATTESIYTAALMAATLDLPVNPNLGFSFLIPYKSKSVTLCQFQISARGFKQLAQRSGLYNRISDSIVYEGQLVEENPLTGYKFDWTAKKSETITGYVSYFRLVNGFESTLYMTLEQCLNHGLRYSKTFSSKTQWVKDNSKWTTDFDAMALKTVTKLNLYRNGPLSIDMQKAQLSDQSIIKDETLTEFEYVDNNNTEEKPDRELERATMLLNESETLVDLQSIWDSLGPDLQAQLTDLMETKYAELEK